MKGARCGAEVTNKIIKINGVIYCENCVKELGYDRFLKNPEELLGAAFSPLDEIASSFAKMAELDFGNSALTCPIFLTIQLTESMRTTLTAELMRPTAVARLYCR